MVIEEFISKFSFKADTSKLHNFANKMNDAKENAMGADSSWGKFQDQLKKGIPNQWFTSMSGFITTFNRSRVFLNGFKNTFQLLNKLPFGGVFKGISNAITGVMVPMNRFGLTLTRIRSSVRSWMHVMQNGWRSIWTSFKGHLLNVWTAAKSGLARLGPMVKAQMLKMKAFIIKTWNQVVIAIMSGNNKFLKSMLTGFQKAGSGIGKALSGFGGKLQGMTSGIPVIGKALSAIPAAAVGAVAALGLIVVGIIAVVKAIKAIAAATRSFIEFETAIKGVQKVTLASSSEMNRLSAAAMAAGEASIFTVKEAAEAQKFLAMAGLSVDQVMKALPGTLQLAAAGEMDLATAADLATNIMSSNALKVKDLTRVNDVLAYTAANANTSVVELGGGLANIGPFGRLAGLGIEELSSWLGTLANQGLKGAEAGTMVRNAIMDLQNPTAKMITAMEAGGIAIGDFIDETGQISNINELLMAFEQMDAVSRQGFIASLDQRTAKALAPVITGAAQAMADFNKELGNAGGTAAKMASIAFTGLSGAVKQYKSKMGAASVRFIKNSSLDKFFEEVVRFAADILPPLIDTIGLLLRPIVFILRLFFTILTAVGVVFKGLLQIVNVLGGALLKGLVWPFEKVLDLFNFLMGKLRQFFDWLVNIQTGPLSVIIGWITGLLDKLAGFFTKFKNFFGKDVEIGASAADAFGGGSSSNNNSTSNVNIDSPINISGVDPNNAAAVAGAARSAVAVEIRKILVEVGI